jgi:uncharacterized delta-60 repeat protein
MISLHTRNILAVISLLLIPILSWGQGAGDLDLSFNSAGTGANSTVRTTAVQADGKIIFGGDFTSYNGTSRNKIARINADGSLDATFNPGTGADDGVYTTALQADGKILIGGYLTSYNATSRNKIARLNADGSLDTSFNPGTGAVSRVRTTAVQADGKIIIGGEFTSYNGTSRNYIARLNADGSLDATFNPGTGANNFVSTTALQTDGKIIIGGDFTSYNGTPRNYIARLNTDGSLDTSFNPGTGANINFFTSAVQSDGKIIIGGNFTSYNGTSRNRIARLNTDGSLDATFNPGTGANHYVYTIALQADGKIIIGGWFTSYNGTTRNRIARLNADGGLDANFNPGTGVNDEVFTSAVKADGKIIIGGGFNTYNGTSRNYIASIYSNSCTTPPTPTITGATTFCAGGSTILTSSAPTGNLWSNGDTTRTITVMASGNYTVRVVSGACTSAFSSAVAVSVTPLPTSPIILGNSTFCSGGSTTLTSSSATGNLWSNGARSQSITITEAGNYTVKVISGNCTSAVSDTFRVIVNRPTSSSIAQTICQGSSYQFGGLPRTTAGIYNNTLTNSLGCDSVVTLELTVNPLPTTPIISGNNTICAGDSTILTSSIAIGNLWSTGDTTRRITVTTAGSYTVRAIAGPCTSNNSIAIIVTEEPTPEIPVIRATRTNLIGSDSCVLTVNNLTPNAVYEWSNGQLGRRIVIRNSDTVRVRAVLNNCASDYSIPVIITGIANKALASVLQVFPNPATDKVTINTNGTGTLEILNTLGQVVITQPATETNEIDVSKLNHGVYIVRFNGASQKLVVR